MRYRIPRIAASLGVLAGLIALPVTAVLACSCVGAEPAQRLAQTDVVFVGVVVEEREPEETTGFSEAIYIFDVELSAKPTATPYGVAAWWGGDANCGFDMDVGERWLVFATIEEGVPRTNLCHGTAPMAGVDPVLRRLVDTRLTELPRPGVGGGAMDRQPGPIPGMDSVEEQVPLAREAAPSASTPIFLIGAVMLVIVGVSAVAFRRSRPG